MTQVAFGIGMPASRGILKRYPAPLDIVTGVTITGAWSLSRQMLSSFSGYRGQVRDTATSGVSNFATPAEADAFLNGDAGAVVSLYDQSGAGHTMTQVTTTLQPAYSSAVGPNSRAGSVFDANSYLRGQALNNFVSAGAGYFIAVCSASTLSGTQQTIYAANGGYVGLSFDGASKARSLLYDGTANNYAVAPDVIGVGALFVAELWFDGTDVYCRVNGNAPISHAAGNLTAVGLAAAFNIGGYYTNYGLRGSWLEGATMSALPAQADALVADLKAWNGVS